MPVATLKFQLPEEEGDFKSAIQGREAKTILWEIDQRLRSLLKHGEPNEQEARLAEEIREMIPGALLDD
jgi:glutamate-1-semialdehyde aminotransferase